MSRRRIHTTKILAVALSASTMVGCATAAPEPKSPAPVAEVAEVSAPAEAAPTPDVAFATETSPAPAETEATPPAAEKGLAAVPGEQPKQATKAQLATLRGELIAAGRVGATTQRARFRPLCDADGYPLVGNLVRKGDDSADYQPSAFCTDVRNAK